MRFLAALAALGLILPVQGSAGAKRVAWQDLAPLHGRLEASGLTATSFAAYLDRTRRDNARRVREGDLDHLVFYLLQSTHFTSVPAIEPALSAKRLVDSLDPAEREAFLRASRVPRARIPPLVRSRVEALLRGLDSPDPDARLIYFRSLAEAAFPTARQREDEILHQYTRVMRFVYEKEFVAQRSANPSVAVAELYRTRGLSTDTAVEAGYLVYLGLATVRALEPTRRIRRVLIVGPGLDLAPRTGFVEVGAPESYQPYAVVDSLVALGLAGLDDLTVLGADVNPRVVNHLRTARDRDVTLTLVTGIGDSDTVTLQDDYRTYFSALGRSIGEAAAEPELPDRYRGHLRKSVRVRRMVSRVIDGVTVDITTQRINQGAFDLVIATNIFPYLDDDQLALALANISAMLAPGGILLHNEARPLVSEVSAELDLPLDHSRTAPIAAVRGSATPLYDSVFLHVKKPSAGAR